MTRRIAILLGALAVACATAAPAHAADSLLAPAPVASGLSAYGGHAVWSARDATGQWRLVHWHAGTVTALPVPTRSVPFDADLGPGAAGAPVVLYSRCTTEPAAPSGLARTPDWSTASGCDVYQAPLDGGTEQPLAEVNTRYGSETTPSRWHGDVAFARRERGRHIAKLLLLRAGARNSSRLGGGSIQVCSAGCPGTHPRAGVESLELRGRNVTYVWRMTGGMTYGIGPVWELRVARTDGSASLMADDGLISGTCGYRLPFAGAVIGGVLRYGVEGGECDTSFTHFATWDLSSGVRGEADSAPGVIHGLSHDGALAYWLRGSAVPNAQQAAERGCLNPLAACGLVLSGGIGYAVMPARGQAPSAAVDVTSYGYRWARGPRGSRLLRPPATIACLPGRTPAPLYVNARGVRSFAATRIDRSGRTQAIGARSEPLALGSYKISRLTGCGRAFRLRYDVEVGGRRSRVTYTLRVLAPRGY